MFPLDAIQQKKSLRHVPMEPRSSLLTFTSIILDQSDKRFHDGLDLSSRGVGDKGIEGVLGFTILQVSEQIGFHPVWTNTVDPNVAHCREQIKGSSMTDHGVLTGSIRSQLPT
jgi:hypothetical protein